MNRKTLIYGCLGIAATAFIVDRVFLSEPAGAGADSLNSMRHPPVIQKPPGKATTDATPDSEHPVLSLLSQLGDTISHRDIFAPSPSMISHLDERPQAESGQRLSPEKEEKEQGRKTFQDAHELQATSITPGAEMVIVDGKVLRLGDTLDGFTLEKIKPYSATFQQDDAVVELNLPAQP